MLIADIRNDGSATYTIAVPTWEVLQDDTGQWRLLTRAHGVTERSAPFATSGQARQAAVTCAQAWRGLLRAPVAGGDIMLTLAARAYAAYIEVMDPLAPWGMPPFAELPAIHQRAWEAVAAVLVPPEEGSL